MAHDPENADVEWIRQKQNSLPPPPEGKKQRLFGCIKDHRRQEQYVLVF